MSKKLTINNLLKCNPCSDGIRSFKDYVTNTLGLDRDDEIPLDDTIRSNKLWMDFYYMKKFGSSKEDGYKLELTKVGRYDKRK